MKKKISLNLEHKQCYLCQYWECANELGSFCSNKLVKAKNISGNCKRYKPKSLFQYYKTTNGVFASIILENKKGIFEIKLKKGYKTEARAKNALENVGKRLGFLK